MRLRIVTIAAALLSVLCWWTADANASCAGCPPGFECFVPPDLGFHYGSCVPVAEPMKAPELPCYCFNSGQYRAEVKLYPCDCFSVSEHPWFQDWEQLGKGMPLPKIRNWSELLEEHAPCPSEIMR